MFKLKKKACFQKKTKHFPTHRAYKSNKFVRFFSSSTLTILALILLLGIELLLIIFDEQGIIDYLKQHNYVQDSFSRFSYYKCFLIFFMILQTFIAISYFITKKEISKKRKNTTRLFKETNIDFLLTLLAKALNIEDGSRFTIFRPDSENEKNMKIFYRKHLGRTKAKCNNSLVFQEGKGLVGKAKSKPFVMGKNDNEIESFLSKVFVHHLSPDLPQIKNIKSTNKRRLLEYEIYFQNQFDISPHFFGQLSNYKYKIKSYLSIGFISNTLDNVVVLSIDSLNENVFLDIEKAIDFYQASGYNLDTSDSVRAQNDLSNGYDVPYGTSVITDEVLFLFVQILYLLHSTVYIGYNGHMRE